MEKEKIIKYECGCVAKKIVHNFHLPEQDTWEVIEFCHQHQPQEGYECHCDICDGRV